MRKLLIGEVMFLLLVQPSGVHDRYVAMFSIETTAIAISQVLTRTYADLNKIDPSFVFLISHRALKSPSDCNAFEISRVGSC